MEFFGVFPALLQKMLHIIKRQLFLSKKLS
jgi:hypothetical protein